MTSSYSGLIELAGPHIRGAVDDGIELGLRMAIDCLKGAQPGVAVENQTWDSALALLAIVKAEHEARAALSGRQS
jgi:hypothetical protein